MNTADIRQTFEDFCGTSRFVKFVDEVQAFVCETGRLRFWQEQLWAKFYASCSGDLPSTGDIPDLIELFRICPLHRVELQLDLLRPVPHMPPSYAAAYMYACNTLFPYAREECYVGRHDRGSTFIEVFYCPRCRRAKAEWLSHDELPIVAISETLTVPGKPFAVEFAVPWQASHKIEEGMKVLLHRTGEGVPCSTRIIQLERCRECLSSGQDGQVHFFAVLEGVTSDQQVPEGTEIEFVG